MNNKHIPPAVGEFAVGERDQLLARIAEQAREIERLRLNIAEYNEHERCYQSEIAALKSQPSGVVQWPDADEIMQMAFEEGQPSEDASGYYFELEEFDLFIQRLMEEVARLNSSPVSGSDDDDQAYDAEAERLTAEALGTGVGINPNATSVDDIFLDASAGGVDERAAFEAAMGTGILQEQGKFSLSRAYEEGQPYTFLVTKWAWEAWQARAALSAPSHGEQVREVVAATKEAVDYLNANSLSSIASSSICHRRMRNALAMLAAAPSAGSQREQGE